MARTNGMAQPTGMNTPIHRGYHENLTGLKVTFSVEPVIRHTLGRSNELISFTGISTVDRAIRATLARIDHQRRDHRVVTIIPKGKPPPTAARLEKAMPSPRAN